jgi:hypothetical protein
MALPPPSPHQLAAVPAARATRRELVTSIVLMVVGVGTVVWGALVFSWAPSPPSSPDDYGGCGEDFDALGQLRGLWLPWLILVVLAIVGLAVRLRMTDHGRVDRRVSIITTIGVVGAVVLCPLMAASALTANCGM